MERKIGEIFTCNGKTYQVAKGITCDGCTFMKEGNCYTVRELIGFCDYTNRTDKISIIFKEINNMEIKNNQLTIDIPEGMEIDLENSDLAKGIIKFKFKFKGPTYEEVFKALNIKEVRGITVSVEHRDKLQALAQLMLIAKYYNEDWEPDWSNQNEYKYSIIYNRNTYKVDHNWTTISSNIYFKNKDDAQYVIDNPNFRSILDAIYKN